jgi:hypothetical protein
VHSAGSGCQKREDTKRSENDHPPPDRDARNLHGIQDLQQRILVSYLLERNAINNGKDNYGWNIVVMQCRKWIRRNQQLSQWNCLAVRGPAQERRRTRRWNRMRQ